jgi:lipopolysaccharide/colanic/teichoic acid biosynthesis glycosyltransferase
MKSGMTQGRISRWALAASLLALLLLGGVFLAQTPKYHGYTVFQTSESLKIVFLQRGQPTRQQCEAVVDPIVKTMLAQCGNCRLLERWCLDELDPRHRKILSGLPMDVPVMRVPGGAVAFLSNAPGDALEICREAGRHASNSVPAECVAASVASTAISLAWLDGITEAIVLPTFNPTWRLILFAAVMSLVALFLALRSRRLNSRSNLDIAVDVPTRSDSRDWTAAQVIKRCVDLFLAIVLLVILSPLLLLASLLILVFEGRPIFYISRRHISASQAVLILKFRSMVKDAKEPKYRLNERFMRDGYLDVPLTCEVYTPMGHLLERTQLVEIPQLLNILIHGLSFVGNRPLPAANVAHLKANFPDWAERFDSPAGITGIAQVVGRRNLTPNDRIELESLYSHVYQYGNILKCDLKIIFITAWVVLFAEGITVSRARELLMSCLPNEMQTTWSDSRLQG